MITSIDAENLFDKIQFKFMIKTPEIGLRVNFPQHNKGHI